jgi:hypothetical protein
VGEGRDRVESLSVTVRARVAFALADAIDRLAPRPANETASRTLLVATLIEKGEAATTRTRRIHA